MSLRSFYFLFGLLLCLEQLPLNNAAPQLHLRKLYGSTHDLRTKKDALSFPQVDEDVLELEHLQHKTMSENSDEIAAFPSSNNNNNNNNNDNNKNDDEIVPAIDAFENPINSDDASLEKQLKSKATKINNDEIDITTTTTSTINLSGQLEQEEKIIVQHRPPNVPSFAKPQLIPPSTIQQQQSQHHHNKQNEFLEHFHQNNSHNHEIHADMNEKSPSPAKSFYGAARLAFGQNPEVLPPTSTTTTTATSSTAAGAAAAISTPTITTQILTDEIPENNVVSLSSGILDQMEKEINMEEQEDVVDGETIATATIENSHNNNNNNNNNNKEVIEDPIVAELESTKTNVERRSVDRIPPKTAESLLKHAESSFDMAQYVFWTGDEAGVARAVEEFIQQGLMSRENAIKFLREIRLGIDYLQRSYDNRVLPEQKENGYKMNENSEVFKKNHIQPTTIIYAENKFSQLKPNQLRQTLTTDQDIQIQPTISNIQKTLNGLPTLIRIREMTYGIKDNNNNNDEDDVAGRARLADFLYTEYTLEEVIYQLAKVMFSQSLTHGSEQSQKALQRLTTFLQTEGELGRISPSLQKKVLDVLLAALSDTLASHPELLAAARANLGKTFHQIQQNSLDNVKH